MSSTCWFIITIFCHFSATSLALHCFECSNLADPKCGKTFEYSTGSPEAQKLLTECKGDVTFCRKLEYHDDFQGKKTGGVVVTRSCWNSPGEEGFAPDEKCTEMFSGEVCYCKTGSCNRSELLKASSALLLLGLLPLFLRNL